MSTPSTPPPEPGLYAGKYRLVREIGRGGMGAVFEAVEVALDRVVAIKRFPGDISGSLEARQRFRREVTAAAKLTHPGIAQVLGFGSTDEGEHYIAMELIAGESLWHEAQRVTSPRDLLGLFEQILAVLSYAHARGVVHRDLKPENILVAKVGSASICKLLDFGVARTDFVDRLRGPSSTRPPASVRSPGSIPPPPPSSTSFLAPSSPAVREVVGTPRYMAPEQVLGEVVGPAADLYAVGVMLYEALTGSIPIAGRGEDVMSRKIRETAPGLAATRFGPPSRELSRFVERLLDRDPAGRFVSAADARAALQSCPEISDPISRRSFPPPSVRPSDAPETVRIARAATGLEPARSLPFVGRQSERGRLADALAEVTATGTARLVVVEGPTGIGKTHLVDWFMRQVREEGGRTVMGAAYVETGGPEGDAIRASIERHLGAWGQGREVVARAVARFVARAGGADVEEQAALTEWLRPDGAREAADLGLGGRRSRALALMERTLRRIAAERPVVLALDDLQVGGQSALDALGFLLAMWRQEPARILVVASLRTPLDDRAARHAYRKIAAHEGSQVLRLPLEALTPDQSSKLITAVLEDRGAPELASISFRAAGNPLFAIQLARLAREAPPPSTDDRPSEPIAGVVSARRLREGYLPASVQQLIEARLDAAIARAGDPDTASVVLTEIAVLLPPAPTMLVELALHGDGVGVAEAQRTLDELVETGIVREVLSNGEEALEFDHPLVGEVLHTRVNPRMLRRYSAQALGLKEAHYGPGQRERVLHELAEHAFHAGLGDRARELGLTAAHRALAAGRYGEAMKFVRRLAEAERGEPSAARTEVALLSARIADETGDARFAEAALAAAVTGSAAGALEAALALARALARVGRLGEAAGATDRAAAIAGSLADDASPGLDDAKAEVLRLRASIARREGRHHEAVMLLERLLGEHPGAPPRVQRLVQDNLAWARHLAGDQPGALEAARRALELSAGGLERGWALRTLAVIGREALVSAERKEHLEQALAIARELGTFRLLASALTHLGDLQRAAGEPAQAMASFRQVVQVGSEHVDHDDHSSSLASLAMMLVDDRRGNEGAALLRGRKAGASSWERALGLVAAACAASLGDVDGAALEAMAIRAAEEELPTSWGVARAAEVLADAFRRSEREELAAWASAQAAHVTAHLGTSSEAARPESMPPDTSGEVTLEATRREVSYAGVYDRISRLRAALVERGEQRMLASIDRALDRGSPREAFAELRPVLLRAADTGRLDGATSQALVDALRAVDEALAR